MKGQPFFWSHFILSKDGKIAAFQDAAPLSHHENKRIWLSYNPASFLSRMEMVLFLMKIIMDYAVSGKYLLSFFSVILIRTT